MITEAAAAPAFELALPAEIVKALSGKRIALAGFSEPEAKRIAQVLDRAEMFHAGHRGASPKASRRQSSSDSISSY
jgi:hypothetical protein